jgi:hypothetical protein
MTRDSNRPRIGHAVTDPSSFIEVESFELADAGPGAAILRLLAHARDPARIPAPVAIVVRAGDDEQWLSPVPLPVPTATLISTVFVAPAALVAGPASFSLRLSDGSALTLPPPEPTERASASPDELSELRYRLASAESQLEETRTLAATMAAEIEEAQTRTDALAEVVRAETARREALQVRLVEDVGAAEAARADAEEAVTRLEQELRELRAESRK